MRATNRSGVAFGVDWKDGTIVLAFEIDTVMVIFHDDGKYGIRNTDSVVGVVRQPMRHAGHYARDRPSRAGRSSSAAQRTEWPERVRAGGRLGRRSCVLMGSRPAGWANVERNRRGYGGTKTEGGEYTPPRSGIAWAQR